MNRFDLGVRIAQLGQIRRPRPCVQLGEQAVISRRCLCLSHRLLGSFRLPKTIARVGTGGLAGCDDFVTADGTVLIFGVDPCAR